MLFLRLFQQNMQKYTSQDLMYLEYQVYNEALQLQTETYCRIFEVLVKISYRPPACHVTKIYRIHVHRVNILAVTSPVKYFQYYLRGALARSDVVTLDITCEICYLFFRLKRYHTLLAHGSIQNVYTSLIDSLTNRKCCMTDWIFK